MQISTDISNHISRTVHGGCSSHSECNPMLLCHLWLKNIATIQTSLRYIELNPSRKQSLFHQHQVWVTLQLALHLLLVMILQLYHFSPPLPPPIRISSCLLTQWQLLYASCCIVLLYFSRYSTARLKMFYFVVFLMYYLCERYYKPFIVKYYIVICISWVPRLTLLNLQTELMNML